MLEREIEGEIHGLQHSQWCLSMANINIYKRHMIFVSEIFMFMQK